MTACTNHGGKARRVVTAALVGVLSVGTVPMVALAEGVSDGIQQLAADWTTGAKVSRATDGQGNQLTGDLSKQTFKKGSGKYLVPTELVGDFATTDVTEDDLTYYESDQSTEISNPEVFFKSAPEGIYYVSVTIDRTESAKFAFKVADGVSLEGAYAYVGSTTNTDIVFNNTKLFDGSDDAIKFADADGYALEMSDYTVTWTDTKGDPVTTTETALAGSYVAKIVEDANPDNTVNVKVTVSPLDLSEATVVYADSTDAPTEADFFNKLTVNGESTAPEAQQGTNLGALLKVDAVEASDGSSSWSVRGAYTVTISPDFTGYESFKGSITGSAEVNFSYLNTDVFDASEEGFVAYDGEDATSGISVRLDKGESFDASKVAVEWNGQTFSGDQLELSYTKSGKAIDASELSKADSYVMNVRVKPFDDFTKGVTGGSTTINVNVTGNTVDADDELAFYLDGELAGTADSVTYDGTDQLDRLSVSIKKGSKTYAEGTDYTLEVKNLDTNKAVDQAVDSGKYQVTVKPLTFTLDNASGAVFTLTVTKAQIALSASTTGETLKDYLYSSAPYVNDALGYTGSALEVPAVKYPVLNADGTVKKEDGKVVYAELDPSMYNVVSIRTTKAVKEIKDVDVYTVKIALTDDAAKNYQLNDQDFKVEVKKYSPFGDVESPAWYAGVVETAKHNGYVNGMSGTNLFAPEVDITRADAVCIIFNMAGGENAFSNPSAPGYNDFQYSETTGWVTGFDDVDGHAYYAKALAWAHAAGVANGNNGEFRPTDKITREEFAALLANYAKSKGDYATPSADALDGVSDASTVSGWATEVVSWAVENGVMGNGGYVKATDNILRAEVAAMAVNYQPEKLA